MAKRRGTKVEPAAFTPDSAPEGHEQYSYGEDLKALDIPAYTDEWAPAMSGYKLSPTAGGYTGWSSWYSGYSSTKAAMKSVHRNATTFIKSRTDVRDLVILTNLSDAEADDDSRHDLHARIDASLYETLGLEEAQQHYTIDVIAQVLALQAFPSHYVIQVLQTWQHPLELITREIVTEITRKRGLALLAEEMPGWENRITSFKEAMSVAPPKDGDPLAGALMYAAWDPPTAMSFLEETACNTIKTIEGILDSTPLGPDGTPVDPSVTANKVCSAIVEFIAESSPLGAIIKRAKTLVAILDDSIAEQAQAGLSADGAMEPRRLVQYLEAAKALELSILNHHKTMRDPSTGNLVLVDYPTLEPCDLDETNRLNLKRASDTFWSISTANKLVGAAPSLLDIGSGDGVQETEAFMVSERNAIAILKGRADKLKETSAINGDAFSEYANRPDVQAVFSMRLTPMGQFKGATLVDRENITPAIDELISDGILLGNKVEGDIRNALSYQERIKKGEVSAAAASANHETAWVNSANHHLQVALMYINQLLEKLSKGMEMQKPPTRANKDDRKLNSCSDDLEVVGSAIDEDLPPIGTEDEIDTFPGVDLFDLTSTLASY